MLPLTPRLEKLKDRLFNIEYHDPGVWYFQDMNILAIKGNEFMMDEPVVVRKALMHTSTSAVTCPPSSAPTS